jgi:hypothetical protein
VSRDRIVAIAAAVATALVLSACGGGAGADVPDGWTEVADDDLRFAVPPDANESDPPLDAQARTEHVLGDVDDLTAPYIASYRSSVFTDAGDRADAGTYAAQLFGVEGALGRMEDYTTTELTDVDVPGADEAGRMQVSYEDPDQGTVRFHVLLVVTDEHIYDLRVGGSGDDVPPEADVDALFGSVSVEG